MREIKWEDLKKEIGNIIWFENGELKSKPRKLTKVLPNDCIVLDNYLYAQRPTDIKNIKLFTY